MTKLVIKPRKLIIGYPNGQTILLLPHLRVDIFLEGVAEIIRVRAERSDPQELLQLRDALYGVFEPAVAVRVFFEVPGWFEGEAEMGRPVWRGARVGVARSGTRRGTASRRRPRLLASNTRCGMLAF